MRLRGGAALEAESGGGGDHRCLAGVDGGDDLGVVNPLQIDGRDPEVGVPQLALDDVERDALVGELDRVRMAQLVRHEPPPHMNSPFRGRMRRRGVNGAQCLFRVSPSRAKDEA